MNTQHIAFYFLMSLLFWLPSQLWAQTDDTVYLKNGGFIRGIITEQIPDQYIKIQTVEGEIQQFEAAEIEEIELAKKHTRSKEGAQKGFYGMTQIGLMAGYQHSNWGITETEIIPSLQVSAGYRFHHLAALGAGTALDVYQYSMMMPIFAEVRGDFLKRDLTPHYFIRYGFPVVFEKEGDQNQPWNVPRDVTGKQMWEAGLGVNIHTQSRLHVLLTMGMQSTTTEESFTDWDGSEIRRNYAYNRVCFRVGLGF